MSSLSSFRIDSDRPNEEDCSSWWEGVTEAADLSEGWGHNRRSATDVERIFGKCSSGDSSIQDSRSLEECRLQMPTVQAPYTGISLSQTRTSPSCRKISAAKLELNSGREHVSYSGRFRKARNMKETCHENCNRCEVPKMSFEERLEIFNTFWSLSDHERQWLFIYGSVKTTAPRKKQSVLGGKHTSRVYFFNVSGRRRRVCKTMFKNTLCICDSWIDSALSHFKDGFKPDMRGKVREVTKETNFRRKLTASSQCVETSNTSKCQTHSI